MTRQPNGTDNTARMRRVMPLILRWRRDLMKRNEAYYRGWYERMVMRMVPPPPAAPCAEEEG